MCRIVGSPAEGDVTSMASLELLLLQFNDLSFDPFEISPNCYDEEEIWSHAGVEQTAVEAEVKNGLKTEPQIFF